LFLNVANRLVTDDTEERPGFDRTVALTEIWDQGGYIAMFLDFFEGNKTVQLLLAKELVKRLSSGDGVQTPIGQFQIKCLAALINIVDGSSMSSILQEIDSNHFQGENDIHLFVEHLLTNSA
jgi:hypothetical protein